MLGFFLLLLNYHPPLPVHLLRIVIFLSGNYSHLKHDRLSKHREKLLVKQLRSVRLTIIKMAFIKEESEDIKIEEVFSLKQEDTEEQTGWFSVYKCSKALV